MDYVEIVFDQLRGITKEQISQVCGNRSDHSEIRNGIRRLITEKDQIELLRKLRGTSPDVLAYAWDAILALLSCDLITKEQFDIMYGPWQSVFGEPWRNDE